jgi:small subunit ribosomal protein S6
MPLYESTFIARQEISSQEVQKLTDEFSEIVAGKGGKVSRSEYWGVRSLAYRVKKSRKGHYVMLCLDAPVDAVKELKRQYKLSESVMRELTVRVEEFGEDESPLAKGGNDNDVRG